MHNEAHIVNRLISRDMVQQSPGCIDHRRAASAVSGWPGAIEVYPLSEIYQIFIVSLQCFSMRHLLYVSIKLSQKQTFTFITTALPILAPVTVSYSLSFTFVVWKACFSWSCLSRFRSAFFFSRVIEAILHRSIFSCLLDTLLFSWTISSRYSLFRDSHSDSASSKRSVFSFSSR